MQYVYSCLAEATYAQVAEQNGEVIGVIMGKSKFDYRITSHIAYVFSMFRYTIKMKYGHKNEQTGIEDYNKLHELYHDFSKKHKGEFDGVLTLFAVNENCRGLGVGKTLLAGLKEYLRKSKVSRIYLYTDTTCNYGFYEKQGFERLEQQTLELTRDGKPFQMDVFLYGYSV